MQWYEFLLIKIKKKQSLCFTHLLDLIVTFHSICHWKKVYTFMLFCNTGSIGSFWVLLNENVTVLLKYIPLSFMRGYCTLVINIQVGYYRYCDCLSEFLLENKQETIFHYLHRWPTSYFQNYDIKEPNYPFWSQKTPSDSVLGYYNWSKCYLQRAVLF